MKPSDIATVLIEFATAIRALVTFGIITNVVLEELQWLLVELNRIFHVHGRSKLLVQIIASGTGLVLAIGYQLVSVEITIAWAEFAYSNWGVVSYNKHTPHLILFLSLVIYLFASVWLRDPIKRKLHIPKSA